MALQKNFIAGDWLEGDSVIENRNPSDLSDLVGTYAQASSAQLDKAFEAAEAAQVGVVAAQGLEGIGQPGLEAKVEIRHGVLAGVRVWVLSHHGARASIGGAVPCGAWAYVAASRVVSPFFYFGVQRREVSCVCVCVRCCVVLATTVCGVVCGLCEV